ncbi:hypothetical protein [Paenibacillus naphthalenovorans]|uniref:Uncharacterized protein n=1 Tax=Paenibacillus naphthalenovorans TaxID=162209 RepID=A0A0U2W494_9BACL|nr:hypothetical protein [Paenibacillus naphthalenovorans]ALS22237.1 hypothetical protein IJ22_18630 [Paenibacillus naphthalenovorans]
MNENEKMARFLEMQKQQLETLLQNSKGKYDQRKIDMLEVEIEGLTVRIRRWRGEM